VKDALIVTALSVLPRKPLARGMGGLARARLSRVLTRAFVRAYGVDLGEATGALPDYPTLAALFTRELKPGARPIDASPRALVSPVDGTVAAVGHAHDAIEVAPGRSLDVAALLGEPASDAGYGVVVIYLSPRDYHRVHVPREGAAKRWSYLPGTLWPVFPAAVRRVPGLFSRNERVRVSMDCAGQPIDVVLVGAFGVGRIEVAVTDLLTNTGGSASSAVLDPAVPLARGDWLGTFHLGSTVVVATRPGAWTWSVKAGDVVRVGRPIAELAC
jgi:phosphatidylserine decarboxylase